MFVLKLYQNWPTITPSGRTVVLETVGVWVTHCQNGVREIHAFKNQVGVEPSDVFYVGGEPTSEMDAITTGVGGNWYDWGVLENQNGKTTEMFR